MSWKNAADLRMDNLVYRHLVYILKDYLICGFKENVSKEEQVFHARMNDRSFSNGSAANWSSNKTSSNENRFYK